MAELKTILRHAKRSMRARKGGVSHIVVTADLDAGRLKRRAGDPLCKPAESFERGFLDFVPPGDLVCPECAALAERYDLPLPENIEECEALPSSRRLKPGDPPVRYVMESRWFNYEYGFPVAGYLRKWVWIRNRMQCRCGAPIGDRSDEPVLGMELYHYFACAGGDRHPIRDERDLNWKDEFMPRNPGPALASYDGEEVLEAYGWLQVRQEDEVPF